MRKNLLLAFGISILVAFPFIGLGSILLAVALFGVAGAGLGIWKNDRKMLRHSVLALAAEAAFIALFFLALSASNM